MRGVKRRASNSMEQSKLTENNWTQQQSMLGGSKIVKITDGRPECRIPKEAIAQHTFWSMIDAEKRKSQYTSQRDAHHRYQCNLSQTIPETPNLICHACGNTISGLLLPVSSRKCLNSSLNHTQTLLFPFLRPKGRGIITKSPPSSIVDEDMTSSAMKAMHVPPQLIQGLRHPTTNSLPSHLSSPEICSRCEGLLCSKCFREAHTCEKCSAERVCRLCTVLVYYDNHDGPSPYCIDCA